jgi:hypothetical protein
MSVWDDEHKPYQSLPEINTIINFRGDLWTIEDGITIVAV